MIDIHCHILPGMDDGPESIDESIEMCRIAAEDGVRTIVATPHYNPGSDNFAPSKLTTALELLRAAIQAEGLELTLLSGAELAFTTELPARLKEYSFLAINNGRYFLTEFQPSTVPLNWDSFLVSLMAFGFSPVIAHPERNLWFMKHPEALSSAVQKGILLQVTAASITGVLGPEVRDFCSYLLRRNLVHVIASDAHSAGFRDPCLSEAVESTADLIGDERAMAMVTSVPEAIITGRSLRLAEPLAHVLPGEGLKTRWIQRLFS